MATYIERAAAVDAVSEVYYETPDVNLSAEKFEAAINAIPTADVVEVVRCKDCKHLFGTLCTVCGLLSRKPEDFCSYGERKDRDNAEG